MIQQVLRLYVIQIFAFTAICLGSYYPGIDIALALLYFLVIAREARSAHGHKRGKILSVIILWQGPAALLSLMMLNGMNNTGFWGLNAPFLLEFWATALVALLSCFKGPLIAGKAFYYYCIISAPLILGIYYYLLSLSNIEQQKNSIRRLF